MSSAEASALASASQVVLLSPCGWGNLGDAAIQEAAIAGVRRHLGDHTRLIALTQNPSDTSARHGLPAFRIAGFEVANYSLGPEASAAAQPVTPRKTDGAPASAAQNSAPPSPSGIKGVLRRIPFLATALRAGLKFPRAFINEARHWRFALRLMGASKFLIVSGGGQLDEFWGGPWGHPYAMFKWSTAARIKGCRVVFLSVGAGTLANAKSRRFIRRALNIAFYKSFRDPRTVATVKAMHVDGQLNLVPDLAFSHPAGRAPQPAVEHGKRTVIGLSPIVYKDPLRWPEKDGAFFAAYLDELARLGVMLLARGDSVCVLTSDYADNSAAEALFSRIASQVPSDNLPRLLLPDTTEDFLQFLQNCNLLVASRLHGAILAQLVATPVVAISYNWKVDEQMRHSDCAQYCVSIEKFSAVQVLGLIDQALDERIALSARLASAAASAYSLLDQQYERAFRLEKAVAGR